MLTHENVVSDAAGVIKSFDVSPLELSSLIIKLFKASGSKAASVPQAAITPNTEDVSISFLPLAHMFERVVQVSLGSQTLHRAKRVRLET